MISSRRLRAITGGVAAVMLSALVTATPTEASRPTAASVERAVRVSVHGPAHLPLKVRSLTAHGRAAHAGKRATVTLYERSGRRWHRVGKSKRLRSGGKYGFYRKHREGGTYRYRVTVRSRTGKLLDRSKVLRTHAHKFKLPPLPPLPSSPAAAAPSGTASAAAVQLGELTCLGTTNPLVRTVAPYQLAHTGYVWWIVQYATPDAQGNPAHFGYGSYYSNSADQYGYLNGNWYQYGNGVQNADTVAVSQQGLAIAAYNWIYVWNGQNWSKPIEYGYSPSANIPGSIWCLT